MQAYFSKPRLACIALIEKTQRNTSIVSPLKPSIERETICI
jgi:hypothetical protein